MTKPTKQNLPNNGRNTLEERIVEKADWLAVRSRQQSCSCTQLAKEIEQALLEAFNEGREEGIKASLKIAMNSYPFVDEYQTQMKKDILSLLPRKEKPEVEK